MTTLNEADKKSNQQVARNVIVKSRQEQRKDYLQVPRTVFRDEVIFDVGHLIALECLRDTLCIILVHNFYNL